MFFVLYYRGRKKAEKSRGGVEGGVLVEEEDNRNR